MAGWCSNAGGDDEPLNLNLFLRRSFGFQGLPDEKESVLRKIVTQLGATCDDLPKYIFCTEEYFNSLTEYASSLYNVTFIRDSVDANRCLNIEHYRFGPKYVEKKDYRDFDPCCKNFHNDQEACIVCDPNFKQEVSSVKQKKKIKELPSLKFEDKNGSVYKKVKCKDSNLNAESVDNNKSVCTKSPWEPWEERLLLDYIICNKLFLLCKGPNLFKRISAEGFLKHRSPDSMRVHFRKNILSAIDTYDLPPLTKRIFKQVRKSAHRKSTSMNQTYLEARKKLKKEMENQVQMKNEKTKKLMKKKTTNKTAT